MVVITIPVGGRIELGTVCQIADAASDTFLAQHGVAGLEINGSWMWRRVAYDKASGRNETDMYPAIVFIAAIRYTAPISKDRDDVAELLSEMIQYLITQVRVDFNASPIHMHFKDAEFHFTKDSISAKAEN